MTIGAGASNQAGKSYGLAGMLSGSSPLFEMTASANSRTRSSPRKTVVPSSTSLFASVIWTDDRALGSWIGLAAVAAAGASASAAAAIIDVNLPVFTCFSLSWQAPLETVLVTQLTGGVQNRIRDVCARLCDGHGTISPRNRHQHCCCAAAPPR